MDKNIIIVSEKIGKMKNICVGNVLTKRNH